jgi:predicted kinase
MGKDKNLKVIITIGLPGSGKSTWKTNFMSKNEGYVAVSRDNFREMLKNAPVCEPNIEKLITGLQDSTILAALNARQNVIVDNTHLKVKYINHIVELVKYKADVEFMLFDIPAKKCIERDALRTKKVGEDVIMKMNKDFLILRDSFDFQNKTIQKNVHKNPVHDPSLRDIVIFDIDGTLAHHNNARSPFDWMKVGIDTVDNIVADQARFHKQLGHIVYVVSGRDEICREVTSEWLKKHNIPFDGLFMRKNNDNRKDTIIKEEIYNNEFKGKYNVRVVYDDRNSVVKMWRNLGLKVFQVEEGDF